MCYSCIRSARRRGTTLLVFTKISAHNLRPQEQAVHLKTEPKGPPRPYSQSTHARIAHRRRSQSTAVWLTPESRIADVWQIAKNRALLLSLTCVGRYAERRYQSCWCARTWEWVPPCSMAPEYALFAPPLSRTALPSHPVSHVVACTPSVLHWMCLLPVAVPVRSSP